jgi:hypothetical protein
MRRRRSSSRQPCNMPKARRPAFVSRAARGMRRRARPGGVSSRRRCGRTTDQLGPNGG